MHLPFPIHKKRFPCPCCGCLTYPAVPKGEYDICPVCFWEDGPSAYENPDDIGCNGVSLTDASKNFRTFGACREDMLPHVRKPYPEELP